MTKWVLIYCAEALMLYVLFAPRKWKPWSRRADRQEVERKIRWAKWDEKHPTPKRQREIRLEEARTGDITGNTSDPEIMRIAHDRLVQAGCLDPGEPTPWSHYEWNRKMTREFTPEERMMIRSRFAATPEVSP